MKDDHGNGPRDVKRPPTVADVQAHLDGAVPVGFWPARADGMTRRIVIDIDGKDQPGGYVAISQEGVVKRIEKYVLPLVNTRSKSGGLHLDCFLTESIPQAKAYALGRKMARLLGFPKAEVFPPASGPGNWVILPYFRSDSLLRCRKVSIAEDEPNWFMTAAEFRDFAMGRR